MTEKNQIKSHYEHTQCIAGTYRVSNI